MKHKKKVGKTPRKQTFFRQNKRKILVLAIFVTLIAIGSYNIFHKRAQASLKRDLDTVGVELDKLAETLDNTLPDHAVVERKRWCYRAGRKFEREPIYCTQRLYVTAKNISDEEILSDAEMLTKKLEDSWLSLKMKHEKRHSDENISLYLVRSYDRRTVLSHSYCDGIFTGFGSRSDSEIYSHNQYELGITCMGNGNFDKYIYPPSEE